MACLACCSIITCLYSACPFCPGYTPHNPILTPQFSWHLLTFQEKIQMSLPLLCFSDYPENWLPILFMPNIDMYWRLCKSHCIHLLTYLLLQGFLKTEPVYWHPAYCLEHRGLKCLLIYVQYTNKWCIHRSLEEGKMAAEKEEKVLDSGGGRISAGRGHPIVDMMGQTAWGKAESRLNHPLQYRAQGHC